MSRTYQLRGYDACLRRVYVAVWRVQLCIQAEVTFRTMSDGSLIRTLLQAGNLSPALPPSSERKVSSCRTHFWRILDSVLGLTWFQFPRNMGSVLVRSFPEHIDQALLKQHTTVAFLLTCNGEGRAICPSDSGAGTTNKNLDSPVS